MARALDADDGKFFNARLTWCPGSIAPFESAWSVFARVMATNYLTWNEIQRLLRSSSSDATAWASEFLSARNIELDTYASLLGEKKSDIETGFLDTLGFPSFLLGMRGIRHCPECARAGYHCTIFSIGALTHCPWHRIPLTQGCVQCGKAIRTMKSHEDIEIVSCPACGMKIVEQAYRLTGTSDVELCRAAKNCCNQIVMWWRTVCNRESAANELLGDVLGARDVDARDDYMMLKWGTVCALAKPPDCFLSSLSATPGVVVKWLGCHNTNSSDEVERGGMAIRHYRSVRRKIFREFVRPHRRCLSILTSAQRPDLYCLDRNSACIVCVAYIAWRMAVEQDIEGTTFELWKLEELFAAMTKTERPPRPIIEHHQPSPDFRVSSLDVSPYRSNRRWKLRVPSLVRSAAPTELVPHILYAYFLQIWMRLESEVFGKNIKISVNFLQNRELGLPIAKFISGSGKYADSLICDFRVVLPSERSLVRRASERCTHRVSSELSMFDDRAWETAERFSWAHPVPYNLLFMLRTTSGPRRRSFRHFEL